MADAQPEKTLQPSEGRFNNPTPSARPFASLCAVRCNLCRDCPPAQPGPIRAGSLCSISMSLTRPFPRPAGRSFNRRDRFYESDEQARATDLSARDLSCQWQATFIYQAMLFAAQLTAIGRIPTRMLTTSQHGYARCINASSMPHDLFMLSKSPQDCPVKALPNTGWHPFMKATPARHTAAAPMLTRQVFPRYSSFSAHRMPARLHDR